ncbi:uncharacterized protein LOC144737849 [Lampetra planeri]
MAHPELPRAVIAMALLATCGADVCTGHARSGVVVASEGDKVVLNCALPRNVTTRSLESIQWRKHDVNIIYHSKKLEKPSVFHGLAFTGNISDGNASMAFLNIQVNDSGHYTCTLEGKSTSIVNNFCLDVERTYTTTTTATESTATQALHVENYWSTRMTVIVGIPVFAIILIVLLTWGYHKHHKTVRATTQRKMQERPSHMQEYANIDKSDNLQDETYENLY